MNGATLRKHRKSAGLTQTDLGNALGVYPSQICRWEQTEVRDFKRIIAIAEALGIKPAILLLDALDD
jgi:transcriptional regulator with XRE-family HTH domain